MLSQVFISGEGIGDDQRARRLGLQRRDIAGRRRQQLLLGPGVPATQIVMQQLGANNAWGSGTYAEPPCRRRQDKRRRGAHLSRQSRRLTGELLANL